MGRLHCVNVKIKLSTFHTSLLTLRTRRKRFRDSGNVRILEGDWTSSFPTLFFVFNCLEGAERINAT